MSLTRLLSDDRRAVRSVACPACGAEPLQKCVGARLRERSSSHIERWRAYRDKEIDTMKLTPWFDHRTKPVREGPYLTRLRDFPEEGYSYWDGEHWGVQRVTIGRAVNLSMNSSYADQHKEWRGVHKPEGVPE